MKRDNRSRTPLAVQGAYYLATGVWGLLHLRSFMRVTGPKTDTWLVKTVSVLVAAIGTSLVLHSRRRRTQPEMHVLALGSAAGLAGIDVYYATKGRISTVYLLDAAAQVGLAAWLAGALSMRDLGRDDVSQRRLLMEGQEPRVAAADVDAAD
jgi:hypothetical protein